MSSNNLKSRSHTLLALAGALAASPAAHAADAELQPIVVTANRSPLLLEHATGQVEVVTRKEIETRNPQRLTDVINLLPGVFSTPGKGMLQPTPNLTLRGVPDDRRTLFLVDGLPLNDGLSGSASLGGLPAGTVSQAEVLYGPMSSLYGGSAMGGVVNFVTRMPTRTEFGLTAGYGDPFEAGKGPAAVRKTLVTAGTRLDNGLAIRATLNWAATEGYRSDWVVAASQPAGTTGGSPMAQRSGTPGILIGKRGKNDWQENGASIKLEQRLANGARWRLGWMLQEYDYGFGTPETYLRTPGGAPTYGPAASATPSSFAGTPGAYSRQLYHAGFDTDLGAGRLNILASYSDIAKNFNVSSNPTVPRGNAEGGPGRITESPAQTFNVDSYWTAALGNHGLTTGVAYRQDKADSRTYDLANWADRGGKGNLYSQAAGRTTLMAAYVQDEWQVNPQWTLQGGLRYDHWRNDRGHSLDPNGERTHSARSASAWNPKLGAAFRPLETLTLRVSAGSAFRAPSIYDLYRSARFTSYSTVANPDLKPETVITWDAGADWKPWQGGLVQLTYFENRFKDLIYLQGSGSLRTRMNAGEAESSGATLGLSQRFGSDSRVFANYTYTHSAVKKNEVSPTSVGKQLMFVPERQAAAGVETRHGSWVLAASARYASKQYSTDNNSDNAAGVPQAYDGYVVADAKVSYRFDRNFTASLAIDNLLDREYFSFYPAPRRSWFAELSYNY